MSTGKPSWIASPCRSPAEAVSHVVPGTAVGMNHRNLQRKLKSKGTSFKEILDEVRREFAQIYMQDVNLSISETSFLLGFSTLDAFYRAFRRWHNTTPKEFLRLRERVQAFAPPAPPPAL